MPDDGQGRQGGRPDSDVDVGIALSPTDADPETVASRVADALTRVVEILRERVDDLSTFRPALARAAGG